MVVCFFFYIFADELMKRWGNTVNPLNVEDNLY